MSVGTKTKLAVALLGVTFLGFALRLAPWQRVFTPSGIRYHGADPYYHVLRSQEIAKDFPRVSWFDPMMAFPEGSPAIWPPLFDQLIASTGLVLGGGTYDGRNVELGAALVPPVAGALTLILVFALGALLIGSEGGLVAALIVAVLPAHLSYSELGRPDQHAAEVLIAGWIYVAFAISSLRRKTSLQGRWRADLLLAVGIAAGFWTWMGMGLHLLLLVIFVGICYVVSPNGDLTALHSAQSLARGGGLGALLLLISLGLWGAKGAVSDASLTGLTGFHIAVVTLAAGFGVCVAVGARIVRPTGTWGRSGLVAAAAALPLLIALASWPVVAQGLGAGLTFILRSDAWYASIQEFRPLLSFDLPLWLELKEVFKLYGAGLALMPLIVLFIARRWRERREMRARLLFLSVLGGSFLCLALWQLRFAYYFSVWLALWLAFGLEVMSDSLTGRGWRSGPSRACALVILAALLTPAGFGIRERARPEDAVHPDMYAALEWLREQPTIEGGEGVMAGWSYGHHIRYFARKPVLVNPFGTAVGAGSMEDAARFFLSRSNAASEEVVERRRLGFVLLQNPVSEVYQFQDLMPDQDSIVTIERNWREGRKVHIERTYWDLISSRLYFFDGSVPPLREDEAVGRFRLVYESPTDYQWAGLQAKRFKVFEVVQGVDVIAQSKPGSTVRAELELTSNAGRRFRWESRSKADEDGSATLTLPYSTEVNGAVVGASEYRIFDAFGEARLSLSNQQVQFGDSIHAELH